MSSAIVELALAALSPECTGYLQAKGFTSPNDLAAKLQQEAFSPPCIENGTAQQLYAPDPRPNMAGVTDTTDLSCRWGNPVMSQFKGTCCGDRPHFNWIVATCEATAGTGQFCKYMPDCIIKGSPKINYVAAYQYDGTNFRLLDESSVGEIDVNGISGDFTNGSGWEKHKNDNRWVGGDWTTKYAPWARAEGPKGPRGVTPPAAMFVLSAENFYYGAFYMLPQLLLNLDGKGQPTGTNCWTWEFDPVEGSGGWRPGQTQGSVNQMYSTNSAQVSGCMPMAYGAAQSNGLQKKFTEPAMFRDYCQKNPQEPGCQPWVAGNDVSWSGGATGSQRFENYWDSPYVFAVVLDRKGYWIYRWIPDAVSGATGWDGISRHHAARVLGPRPKPVTDPRGLKTDVRGDVPEAVILQPGLPTDSACLRASIELPNWCFGSNALGSMAYELNQSKGTPLEGAHNWWMAFTDTQQYADYPISIMGIPAKDLPAATCNTKDTYACDCRMSKAEEELKDGEVSSKASSDLASVMV